MDEFQPTIIVGSQEEETIDKESIDSSRQYIELVQKTKPKFRDETASILRSRLSATTLILSAILFVAFIGNSFAGDIPLLWLRSFILVALISCLIFLRSQRSIHYSRLRTLELIVFGVISIQLMMMMVTRLNSFALQNDGVSTISIRHLYLWAWSILILTYGILIPNSWKRGASAMLPLSVIPYVVLAFQRWLSPAVASMLDQNKATIPVPLPVVAAIIGVFGTHVINSTRRKEYKARKYGQYRLGEKIGGGGMGEVYRAEHVLLKRPCAIKLIKPENEKDVKAILQFEKEVIATSKLTHWNTVEIYDYGHTDDGTFYYVMELLPGSNLGEIVENFGRMDPGRIVYLLMQVCDALEEAHQLGLVHRDLKPGNIFVSQRGGKFDVVKLLDFGLVKERTDEENKNEIENGSFSGTPLFMSPEQASSYGDVDARSDIYSLGANAYYMLTGKPPFSGSTSLEILVAHAKNEILLPSKIATNIPQDLESCVLSCLAKRPEDRFQTVCALKEALLKCSCRTTWSTEDAKKWWNDLKRKANAT